MGTASLATAITASEMPPSPATPGLLDSPRIRAFLPAAPFSPRSNQHHVRLPALLCVVPVPAPCVLLPGLCGSLINCRVVLTDCRLAGL